MSEKKNVAFDVDGTLFCYDTFHKKVMKDIYGDFPLVIRIDNIARKVNNLDILPNTFFMLKLIIFCYSMLTVFKVNYDFALTKYQYEYEEYFLRHLPFEILGKMNNANYTPIIISNNPVIICFKDKLGYECIYSKSKFKTLRRLKKQKGIEYMFGNSLLGDLLPATLLDIIAVYVGKDIPKKIVKKDRRIKHIKCIFCFLKNRS